MSDVNFKTVPVDEAVNAVRAWAEANWPLTREQAMAIRDRLGWTSHPDEYRLLTTNFDLQPEDGTLSAATGAPDLVTFQLSTVAPRGSENEVKDRAWSAYGDYVAALTGLYGPPQHGQSRGVTSAEWTLPNGATVMITGADRLIEANVESPQSREIGEWAVLDEQA